VIPIPHLRLRSLLVGTVGAALIATPLAVAPAQAAPGDTTIALLNFNDFHGRVFSETDKLSVFHERTVEFAGTIEAQRATYGDANTLLLSAGDNIGASVYNSASQADQPTIDVLNALDLKASAVGNHEFDRGYTDLKDRVINATSPNAKWDYLGANVYNKGTTTPAFKEYSIQEVAGIKIGVIGVVTQEAPTLVSPAGVANLDFGDEVTAVNRVATQLKDGNPANGEADVVVAEFHDGASISAPSTLADAVAKTSNFASLVNDTNSKVDVIFNGHTHMTYAWTDGNHANRAIVQAASYGTAIGKVVLTVDSTKKLVDATPSVVPLVAGDAATIAATYPRADAVRTIANAAIAQAAITGAVPVGTQTADITTAFTGGSYDPVNGWTGTARDDRTKESTMGTLVANSLLATLSNPDRGGAEIGITNPGGLRAEFRYLQSSGEGDGVITRAEANSVLPFVNNLWTTTLTGAQLKQVLEEQWQPTAGKYLALGLSSNVSYTYVPTGDRGSHITGVWVNGKKLSDTDTVRVGTFSFLATGGDNFTTFNSGSNTKDSGLVDYEAFIDYLTAHKPVSPSFVKPGVALVAASTAKVGESYTVDVSDLNLTSLGSPDNTSLEVRVGDTLVTTVPVSGGAASATFTMPSTEAVTLTALPSKTVVRVPVTTTPLATTTTLTVNKTKVPYGTAITATAKVTGTTSGTVSFAVAGKTVTAPLVNGVATATLPNDIPVGTQQVVASFVADTVAAASSSAPVKVKVVKAKVVVINKAQISVTSAKRPFTFTVKTKALGDGVWATGTLKTYLHGKLVAKTTLTQADQGTKKITIDSKYLKRYGRGWLTVHTTLTGSSTNNDALVKLIRLILV
jgi:5'-nucleotidase